MELARRYSPPYSWQLEAPPYFGLKDYIGEIGNVQGNNKIGKTPLYSYSYSYEISMRYADADAVFLLPDSR